MSVFVLTMVAILQLAFIVLLLTTLVLGRALAAWRSPRRDQKIEELTAVANHWLASGGDDETLIETIERSDFAAVVGVLQRLGSQVAGDVWEDLVVLVRTTRWFDQVKKRARARVWWRRLSATHALAMVAEPMDLPLIERLVNDKNPVVQLATVATLKRVQNAMLLDATLKLADTTQTVVRRYLLETLTQSPGLDLGVIARRIDNPSSKRQLRILLDLVAELGIPSFLEHVLPHVASDDLEVRIAVARTLGEFPHPSSEASLMALLGDDAWQVRAQAAAGLGATGAIRAAESLRGALNDASWWVRLRAALSLRRLGPEGAEILRKVTPEEDQYAFEMARYILGLDDAAVAEYGGTSVVDYTEVAYAHQAA
jgi:HEAT repeat protein